MVLLSSADFFKFNFKKKKKIQEHYIYQSWCQTVSVKIRTNILLALIWVQTVCKDYQQKSPLARKKLVSDKKP